MSTALYPGKIAACTIMPRALLITSNLARRYQETRYHEGADSTAHGVYARNALGQEWLLRENNITYRTLGGSFDLYFLSGQEADGGSSALETIRQFTNDCVGTPAMHMYWYVHVPTLIIAILA
ncbi:hypothetical protein LTR53_013742 [Teratosphaeriaceae sp. CCFEE 6253]|nr:hypothetical protein LTR53_013742 [Teratosphaeriaceae sp. CCFEE 6253]